MRKVLGLKIASKLAQSLNVALTRGKDSTIVICQAALLASTFKTGRSKETNSLTNMIGTLNAGQEDKKENERIFNVGVLKSLGLSKQPYTIDSGIDIDAQGNVGPADAREDGEMKDEEEVADEYRGVDVGGGDDQFVS